MRETELVVRQIELCNRLRAADSDVRWPPLTHLDPKPVADDRRAVGEVRPRYESELLRIRDFAKVDLVGVRDEKIYLDVSTPAGALRGLVQDQASGRATGGRSAAPADAGRGST
jgi:hypothetical protein